MQYRVILVRWLLDTVQKRHQGDSLVMQHVHTTVPRVDLFGPRQLTAACAGDGQGGFVCFGATSFPFFSIFTLSPFYAPVFGFFFGLNSGQSFDGGAKGGGAAASAAGGTGGGAAGGAGLVMLGGVPSRMRASWVRLATWVPSWVYTCPRARPRAPET